MPLRSTWSAWPSLDSLVARPVRIGQVSFGALCDSGQQSACIDYQALVAQGQSAPDGLMSLFHGTRARYRKVIDAIGAEVIEIEHNRINEIRDYHLKNSLMSVAVADACGNFVTPSPSSMRRRVFWC